MGLSLTGEGRRQVGNGRAASAFVQASSTRCRPARTRSTTRALKPGVPANSRMAEGARHCAQLTLRQS